jgi:ATP/maltotriose-dependent transcriptional regulator MalT
MEMTSTRKRSGQKDISEQNTTSSGKNRREGGGNMYYFPERLVSTLAQIPGYPVTFVEAPSGYGKTTAVREYLKNNLPTGASAHWYTCLGEPPSKTWDGICGLLGHADASVAEAMKGLYPPSMETVADIAALMRELRCESETYLVIDNYQLFENAIPRLLMDVFSVHPGDSPRVVFISQPLPPAVENVHTPAIHRIGAKDFLFDEESISRYCRLSGIKIPEREIERIEKISEGWISAIRLQVDNYGATGALMEINDIDGLIETAVWNKLTREEKEFLVSVSLFDGFTPLQASLMHGSALPENLSSLLKHNAFIHFSQDSGEYYMHSILQAYLRRNFDLKGESFRREMFGRAGRASLAARDYLLAVRFFNLAEDYESVLAMEHWREYFYNQESFVIDMLVEVARKCPRETLKRYPLSLLDFAYYNVPGRAVRRLRFATGLHQRDARGGQKQSGGRRRENSGARPETDRRRTGSAGLVPVLQRHPAHERGAPGGAGALRGRGQRFVFGDDAMDVRQRLHSVHVSKTARVSPMLTCSSYFGNEIKHLSNSGCLRPVTVVPVALPRNSP